MNVNVPRCGSLQFMADDFCERLGLGYVPTPEYSERTVDLGVRIAPELVCFPMKVLIGSAVEALENGADTLVMVAGYGPCRFNYFAEIERRILEREGYRFTLMTFDSPRDSPGEFYRNIRAILSESRVGLVGLMKHAALALRKGRLFDEVEKAAMALRALETEKGAVDLAAGECQEMLASAWSGKEIEEASAAVRERFDHVPFDSQRPHLRVGVVGEMLVSMEPYFNFDILRWLAKRGAVVERSLYTSDIFTPGGHPVLGFTNEDIEREASPYVCHEIGGHGHVNVAAVADYARRGFDAVVHVFPFTCLPEVIAKTVFVRVSSEFDMPVLSISIDEQTGKAGLQTRLEALIDLAWSNQGKKSCAVLAGA